MTPAPEGQPGLTRRALMVGACAMVGIGAATATALPAAADSSVRKLPDGRLAVRVRSIPELERAGGAVRIGSLRGRSVAVARTPTGYRAISLVCPHQGAAVKRDETGWVCPAHGSEFSPTGALELGPAVRGLPVVKSQLKNGLLIIG